MKLKANHDCCSASASASGATACPQCGLVAEGIRCPRCNALKLSSCAGGCSACGSQKGCSTR